ncbi:MAG: hypothetical protein NTU44_09775 [Bacteroidetes bacterium]|nr:hypothetical protein [Bacteroidota bacterium]
MNTNTIDLKKAFTGLAVLAILSLFLSLVAAQGIKKEEPKKAKKMTKTIHIYMETKDENGKSTSVDTVYSYTTDKPVVIKDVRGKTDMQKMLDNLDININLDSIGEKVHSLVMLGDDSLFDSPLFQGFDIEEPGEGDIELELNADCNPDQWMEEWKDGRKRSQFDYYSGQNGWMQGYTPWGKIKEIHIKDRKHGKKIYIETEDDDPPSYFSFPSYFSYPSQPPFPPPPPKPGKPHKVKKIIIEKNKKAE